MGLFGGASGVKQTKPPVYTSLQLQTSAQGLPIPILWGANRLSGNCIDYFNFQKHSQSKGKGGKGGGNYTYTASVMLALCEGASDGYTIQVGRVWNGQNETIIGVAPHGIGGGIFPGTANQAAWSTAAAIGHTLSYPYTCYYAHANLDLGASANLPNFNFELYSTYSGKNVAAGSPDANFGDVIPDFLTNPRYTLNFPAQYLEGFDTLTQYHLAAGIFVSPLLKDAEQVTSLLQRWATVGNFWIFWSGTALKVVCLGDTTITGNGVTFTPNITPVYDLTPDNFVVADRNSNKNEPRIKVTRKDPADGYNQVQLNCSIRSTGSGPTAPAYQDRPYRWQDQTSIDHVGVQAPNTISSSEICTDSVAAVVVSLIGKRQQYIRNDYSFKLPYNFVLLEPGDIVTLTDPLLGFTKVPVRIKQVDEDDKYVLSFVAEQFTQGIGTASIQAYEQWAGSSPFQTNSTPSSTNAPAFLQPPLSLTQNLSQLWIALSGAPDWGGCGVFISFDSGTNYTQVGEIETASLQGTLTASLPLTSGLDTTNVLSIDLALSQGVLPATATYADADAYRTLILVDQELMAYGNVTPTGEYTNDLKYLRRGLYGTSPAAHSAGASFARIDSTKVFEYSIPPSYLGVLLNFKFPSVNVFLNQAQSLADCTAYAFTPVGANPTNLQVFRNYGNVDSHGGAAAEPILTDLVATWDAPANTNTGTYQLRWSSEPAGTSGQTYEYSFDFAGTNSATLSVLGTTEPDTDFAYIQIASAQNGVFSADSYAPAPTSLTETATYNSDGSSAGRVFNWTMPSGAPTPSSFVIGVGFPSAVSVPGSATTLSIGPNATEPGGFPAPGIQALYKNSSSLVTLRSTLVDNPIYAPLITFTLTATLNSDNSVSVSWGYFGGNQPTYYKIFFKPVGHMGATVASQLFAAPTNHYTSQSLNVIYHGLGSFTADVIVSVVTYNAGGTADTFDSSGFPVTSQTATLYGVNIAGG